MRNRIERERNYFLNQIEERDLLVFKNRKITKESENNLTGRMRTVMPKQPEV